MQLDTRPGLLTFQCATLKNWEESGDKASGETGLYTLPGVTYTAVVVYSSTRCLAHDVTHYIIQRAMHFFESLAINNNIDT